MCRKQRSGQGGWSEKSVLQALELFGSYVEEKYFTWAEDFVVRLIDAGW